jgi:hypothetical protein
VRRPAAQGKPDENQAMIVSTYEALYCSVVDTHELGGGFPDLVVGIAGITCLVEVKNADGTLKRSQETFKLDWRGSKPEVVRTEADVIAHVRRVRMRFEDNEAIKP